MTEPKTDIERLVAVQGAAQRYFREQLLASPAAQGPCHYLTQRRLAHVLAADSPWQVGYAPPGWTALTDHLLQAGFSNEELAAAGVACPTRSGGIVDRFRDRIMLAQRDHHGAIVGFVGRAAPGAPADAPKYLNSPRTPIYNKRELLFGLFENRHALTRGGGPVLVEGPLDVLAVSAAGDGADRQPVGVAPCGTSLTIEQVTLLADHLPPGTGVVAAYDNDQAGRRAASAAYELLTQCPSITNEKLAAAPLPREADPADVLRVHGAQALRAALTESGLLVPLGQHAIDAELHTWTPVLDGAEGRIAAVRAVAPLIAKLPKPQVATQVARLAERVHLDPTTVTIALTDAVTARKPAERRRNRVDEPVGPLRTPTVQAATRKPCRPVL